MLGWLRHWVARFASRGDFAPRYWLVELAYSLGWILGPISVRIIDRENKRVEQHLSKIAQTIADLFHAVEMQVFLDGMQQRNQEALAKQMELLQQYGCQDHNVANGLYGQSAYQMGMLQSGYNQLGGIFGQRGLFG
jgi:hypothetical protein